jgi:DNA-binding MarR family transcriptional regulator
VNENFLQAGSDEGHRGDLRDSDGRSLALGGALRRAWVGYQRLLDAEMAKAGFADRRFPDGRVLRLCARRDSVTASSIGRELGITRQGAGKIVNGLRDRDYVTLAPSSGDAREKLITLTPKGRSYLDTQRRAARRIEQRVRELTGDQAFNGLAALLDALADTQEQPRLRAYLSGTHTHRSNPSSHRPDPGHRTGT